MSQESHERDIDLFLNRHIKLGDSDGRKKKCMSRPSLHIYRELLQVGSVIPEEEKFGGIHCLNCVIIESKV
jgi:hypothetical protein